MPAFVNWLLRLAPTNPICMRLIQGGSRRARHLYLRAGYLGVMIVVLLFTLISSGSGTASSLQELAKSGAQTFQMISYLQVGLICLLTPVFMAGAIAQEANPQTWDILLTTPLNSLQIVLGNLLGRLFFVLALLVSTLPLFAVTQYFGGVPGDSIFLSYAIAASSALLVAAIAVTLSVTRTAGRRAVFIFYIAVVLYLFITFAVDQQLPRPVTPGVTETLTSVVTPLNPFLALQVLLDSNNYVPWDMAQSEAGWLTRFWLGRPIAAFCWTCILLSFILVAYSTLRVRVLGAKTAGVPWYRRLLRLGARGAAERPVRHVSHNPIAWRESVARGNTLMAITARWGFVAIGVLAALIIIGIFHSGAWNGDDLRLAVATTIAAEIVIIVLVALNMSATAVSREREDGTLDLILTTPIQPGAYLRGKLQGLIQFLVPLLIVPSVTMLLLAGYVLLDGLGQGGVMMDDPNPTGAGTIAVPVILPVGAIALPLSLVAFVAFCVMLGLQWSIKSKGTIGSVIAAVGVMLVVAGIVSLCGFAAAEAAFLGGLFAPLSPIMLVWSLVNPAEAQAKTIEQGVAAMSISLTIGAALAAAAYVGFVMLMHANMRRTFMMTVRKLAGSS